ncbi:MAG: efflux RND transporter permease subunit [Planctomycetota bacterium]
MRWVIATALRLRVLVLVLAGLLMVAGVRSAREARYDVFPEFAPPRIEVQTEAAGLSSEEIEALVTIPLESALNGTAGLRTLRSKSVLGLSSVVMLFDVGTDLASARLLVQERLAAVAHRLPTLAHPPVILQPLSSTSRAMKIGMWSDHLSRLDLSELAMWVVRPRLLAIQGVANVAVWGQRDRELQVRVDPERARARGITVAAIEDAARAALSTETGGFVDTPNQRLPVRHAPSVLTPEDLGRTVVAFRHGVPVRLADVAEIGTGHAPPIGDAIINDRPGLLLIVEKLPWGNTLDVSRHVEAAMAELRPGLRDVQYDTTIFRPATFIERALDNLRQTILVGCGLVVLVLLLFLFDLRSAFISFTAIPLSLLAAIGLLERLGGTMNTMLLAGLVIAVGEVVDDAIIDVENIARRLRSSPGRAPFAVVLEASFEVRSAVVFGSLVVVLALVPVLSMTGLAGSFFRPLALAYVTAILASLLVALVVTPALCLLVLGRRGARVGDAPLVRALKAVYRRVLPAAVHHPRAAGLVAAGLSVAAGLAATRLDEAFLPEFRERDFLMHWVEKPGVGVDAMARITTRVSKELRAVPGVRNFGSHIGRAEVADEVVGPNFTELWISIDDGAPYEATLDRIRAIVDGYPGLQRDVLTYLKERMKEVLTGASAAVVVRIFGTELPELRRQASAVAAALEGVDGVVDLHVEQQTQVPQVQVRLRPEAALRYGLTARAVRHAVTTLVRGEVVGEVHDGQSVHAVVVRGTEDTHTDVGALQRVWIDAPDGAHVALRDVADVEVVPAANAIAREAASRKIDVTCNVRGRDLGAVARELEARLAKVEFARGYHPQVLGEYVERQASQRRLLGVAGFALLGMLVLLHAAFGAWRPALVVVAALPVALAGGVAAVWLGGGVLSLGSLVGFVTVLGIAARNAILLVSHFRHLEDGEAEPFGLGLVLRGAEERLAPILMTATCAALALLPLALRGDTPGHEIEHPMAIVILGGLVSATLANLVLLPALYLAFGRSRTAGAEV